MKTKALGKASKKFTYADVGVDRKIRAKSKEALALLAATYQSSRHGSIVKLPYGNIFPIGGGLYLDLEIEGVGSKVLIAQLANKYDTIGVDGIALVVNDVIRSGAKPLALADNIHAHVSDPFLVEDWMKGIVRGAGEAECLVPGGEIADVPDVIKGLTEGKGFDMIVASIGELHEEDIIYGNNVKLGDSVIGLRSSGVHSNGITLVRKVLFKQWGGKYEPWAIPEGLERELVFEVLEPMRIYVKPVMKLVDNHLIKAAVHITGDAYLKFNRLMQFNKGIGFEFNNFKPQRIFHLIQEVSKEQRKPISDKEMFSTFNMGWGFAVVVPNASKEDAMDFLERTGFEASQIGKVTDSAKIIVKHDGKRLALK